MDNMPGSMKINPLETLKTSLDNDGLDSAIITKNSNVRYLTGFTGDYGFVAVGRDGAFLVTSELYREQAESTVIDSFTVAVFKESLYDWFTRLGDSFWGKRTGFESESMTFSFYEKFKKKLEHVKHIPTTDLVERIREVKFPSEIQSMSRAQEISDSVFAMLPSLIHEGIEECEIACEIDYRLRKNGGERSAFATIVAFGPNSSLPHAVPSRRKLASGDIVLVDMGTVVGNYSSDMTRTCVFGRADSEQKRVYNLVLDAQKSALDAVTTGKRCSELYNRAYTVFEKAGFGERFIHTLGHGVGLEVHENPRLSRTNDHTLKKNYVITIEPGLYIPGWGGVRIEDMVVVTENGCDNLTHSPKHLIEL